MVPFLTGLRHADDLQTDPVRHWTIHRERVLPRARLPRNVGGDEALSGPSRQVHGQPR